MESQSQEPQVSEGYEVMDEVVSDLCVDYVQFCTTENFHDLLLVTKYQLDEETREVAGGFTLFDTSQG